MLRDVGNFTLLIKNSVVFSQCGNELRYRNIVENVVQRPGSYLSQCIHNISGMDKLCPIFRLSDIVTWSGYNFSKVAVTVRI